MTTAFKNLRSSACQMIWMRNPCASKIKATLFAGLQTEPGPPDLWRTPGPNTPTQPEKDACGLGGASHPLGLTGFPSLCPGAAGRTGSLLRHQGLLEGARDCACLLEHSNAQEQGQGLALWVSGVGQFFITKGCPLYSRATECQ